MTYNIKKSRAKEEKYYRVQVYTAKTSMPVIVEVFNIKAKSENEAEKISKKIANKENPDKPKSYYGTATTGYGNSKMPTKN